MKKQSFRGGTMRAVKIGTSRQVVIPKKFLSELGLTPGDYLEVELVRNRLILTPKILIEKRLAEGLRDIKNGRVLGPFSSAQETLRALRKRSR
jgi:AbrB family looped-hinge helix DNA binding protein